jgi:hypothetical protein
VREPESPGQLWRPWIHASTVEASGDQGDLAGAVAAVVAVTLVDGHHSSRLHPASRTASAMTAVSRYRPLAEIFTVATPPSHRHGATV